MKTSEVYDKFLDKYQGMHRFTMNNLHLLNTLSFERINAICGSNLFTVRSARNVY